MPNLNVYIRKEMYRKLVLLNVKESELINRLLEEYFKNRSGLIKEEELIYEHNRAVLQPDI